MWLDLSRLDYGTHSLSAGGNKVQQICSYPLALTGMHYNMTRHCDVGGVRMLTKITFLCTSGRGVRERVSQP